jgi:glycosyltransferase involved in cell wall biosynthesis
MWRYTDLLAHAAAQVDQFISPSRFTAQIHRERGFPKPLAFLPSFAEPADCEWEKPDPPPQEQPYFLFVGRLEAIKGLQTLIEVWPKMAGVDLLVAGDGGYGARLRAAASSNPRIRFLGALSQRDLGPLYFHALACIVPSLTYETFGTVCVEAFARKTPVVVRDLGALPELVNESGGGLIYRDSEELLVALRRIAASQQFRRELGENGYRAFLRLWSKDVYLKRYFELLENIALRKFGRVPWDQEQGADESPSAPRPPEGLGAAGAGEPSW